MCQTQWSRRIFCLYHRRFHWHRSGGSCWGPPAAFFTKMLSSSFSFFVGFWSSRSTGWIDSSPSDFLVNSSSQCPQKFRNFSPKKFNFFWSNHRPVRTSQFRYFKRISFFSKKFYKKKRLAGCLLRAGYSNFSLRDVHRLFFFYGVLPVKVSLRLGRVLAAVRRQIKGGGIILAARNIFWKILNKFCFNFIEMLNKLVRKFRWPKFKNLVWNFRAEKVFQFVSRHQM